MYDLAIAKQCYLTLASYLPPRVKLSYAVKANPGKPLVRLFASLGACFDCASLGELQNVAEIGLPGNRIFLAGPGKTHEELLLALQLGARIQADGIEDFIRLESLLPKHQNNLQSNNKLTVNLRVHPHSLVTERVPIIGGGGPSAFGVDEETLEDFVRISSRLSNIEIRGVQVFAASNELNASTLLCNHRIAMGIGKKLSQILDRELDCIDVGGGLGIPYSEEEASRSLNLQAVGKNLALLLQENTWFNGEIILEPGRALAGPCGVYLCRVLRTKSSRGKQLAIVEGGINHLLRPLLTGQPFPVRAVGKTGTPLLQLLCGPLCTSLDRLGEHLLPPLEAGDTLIFGQVGAYGFTEGMTHFLSHPLPKEHWIETSIPIGFTNK